MIIFIVLMVIAVLVFAWLYRRKIAAQRVAERQKISRLIRHADEEMELIRKGDTAGITGEFPPPPELRGTGMYISKEGLC